MVEVKDAAPPTPPTLHGLPELFTPKVDMLNSVEKPRIAFLFCFLTWLFRDEGFGCGRKQVVIVV